ncbi:hypothetical protein [Sphingomonas daechungensis]|uniref:hypothetical protein n=1 Tax=Sphingomonas daechungensis TaxID=1176646 RepID=UPI003782FE03
MAHRLIIGLGLIAAATPLSATIQEPQRLSAPAGSPETRYCMHIEAITGSRLEKVRCWTRDEWAAQEVDVDADWATSGVRTIG